ncbi:Protein WALLS ARE THIN 1 [Linum perenne]
MSARIWAEAEKMKLHIAMTVFQLGYAGNHVILRAALNLGISKLVFPIYRNLVALLFLAPFAYFLEKKDRPALTCGILLQFFLLGFVGLEQVHFNTRDGVAKVVGTLTSFVGTSVITLYKGPTLYNPLISPSSSNKPSILVSSPGPKNWTLGCIFNLGHCLCWSSWIVLQAMILKKYPAPFSVYSFTCFFGILQFLIVAFFFEKDPHAWQVHSTGELLSILYSAIVVSGIGFGIQIWVIQRGGPVFVSGYLPLQTMLVAVMASIALGEEFHLGGMIGAILIIAGLYMVLWGKREETKVAAATADVEENKQPLLPSFNN